MKSPLKNTEPLKKNRITHTKEYNEMYWDMMDSKKDYERTNTPLLKNFLKKIYLKKKKRLMKNFEY